MHIVGERLHVNYKQIGWDIFCFLVGKLNIERDGKKERQRSVDENKIHKHMVWLETIKYVEGLSCCRMSADIRERFKPRTTFCVQPEIFHFYFLQLSAIFLSRSDFPKILKSQPCSTTADKCKGISRHLLKLKNLRVH